MTLETDESMGMSSVSEAPRWRDDDDAVRRETQRPARRALQRLELVSADATRLVFAGRRRMSSPIFLCPPTLVLATLPWLAPELTALRLATSALFLGVTGALAAWGWPRRRQLELPARPGAAEAAAPRRWVLDMTLDPDGRTAIYSVEHEPADGPALTVLEGPDPERVLWQLSEVLRHWPAPVECRWGLAAGARPWSIEPHSGPRPRGDAPRDGSIVVPLAHKPLIWCTRLMATFVVLDVLFLVTNAGRSLPVIHPLSITLPVLLVSYLILLSLVVGTGASRLRVGGRVSRETSLLGLVTRRAEVRLESVRGVYALGAPGAERWHVLVDSADGPLALDVPRERAAALARDVEQALQSARSAASA
jgi:hypothetical protein